MRWERCKPDALREGRRWLDLRVGTDVAAEDCRCGRTGERSDNPVWALALRQVAGPRSSRGRILQCRLQQAVVKGKRRPGLLRRIKGV